MRRSLLLSAVLHAVVVILLVFGLPYVSTQLEPPPEAAVAMMFTGSAPPSTQVQTDPTPAQSPAAEPPAAQPPLREPPSEAFPPPPPPPPPAPAPALAAPAPPVAPVAVPPPTPEPAAAPPLPPPLAPVAPPQPAPPAPQPPLPVPPPLVPAPPRPPSATSQPNETKNPAPNSEALENTLERLRHTTRQTRPPVARSNPRASQPQGPVGNDTASLSAAQRGEIGDHVRECWTKDPGALDLEKQRVLLTVTTDAAGTARQAEIAGEDVGRMSDPRFRAFAERARRAVLDVRCANLPLPANLLGKVNVLTFRFTP